MFIPEDWAQVNLKFTGDAIPDVAEMTFGVNIASYVGAPADLASLVITHAGDADLTALWVGDVTLSSVLAKFGPNEDGPFAEVATDLSGTAANPAVPANTSLLIRKVTAVGGRHGRGRMFMPGVPSNQVDSDGTVHSGYLDTAHANWGDFLGKMTTDSAHPALLHAAPGLTPPPYLILDLLPATKLATQRRRLRR